MLSKHRNQRLLLEVRHLRIAPHQHRTVGHVDQAHSAPRQPLSRRANRHRPAVGESQLLFVAGAAGSLAVGRHPFVVEQIAAQFHLGRGHRVIRRHARLRETLRQIQVIVRQRGAAHQGQDCEAHNLLLNPYQFQGLEHTDGTCARFVIRAHQPKRSLISKQRLAVALVRHQDRFVAESRVDFPE